MEAYSKRNVDDDFLTKWSREALVLRVRADDNHRRADQAKRELRKCRIQLADQLARNVQLDKYVQSPDPQSNFYESVCSSSDILLQRSQAGGEIV